MKAIQINSQDNVAVALADLASGYRLTVSGQQLVLAEPVPRGHKFALGTILPGENIIKFGLPIGHAIGEIAPGQLVHSHNLATNLADTLEYQYNPSQTSLEFQDSGLSFQGYPRRGGQVGIRNELWIVPTVGCVNGTAEAIIQRFLAEEPHHFADAVVVFKHSYGCSQLGDDHLNTRKILADIVGHPNAGGVLVLGLGCENNQIDEFRQSLGLYDETRVRFLEAQAVGDEISAGVDFLKELNAKMKKDQRVACPMSQLRIGLKCGGSDGLSGITANPLLGAFSDYLIGQGGTTVLTEVPEMFGAETLLMERAVDREVFQKTVALINDFKSYFLEHRQPIYENPSPGNKAGGITTLEEKSLGCTQKGGSAAVADVLAYGDTLSVQGLNLLNSPGNDLVASTALGAAGCHMVLFTTGRGTPFGSFVPTVKVATNTALAQAKPHWIDFNAGSLVEGTTMEALLAEFTDYVIAVASGRLTNNEINGFREISIFKTGVTL